MRAACSIEGKSESIRWADRFPGSQTVGNSKKTGFSSCEAGSSTSVAYASEHTSRNAVWMIFAVTIPNPAEPICMSGLLHPRQWPWALASRSFLSSETGPWQGALLRCWRGTSPVMLQPPLDHHYVVMHLGGAKHVARRRDGPRVSTVVDCNSLTFVPAGTAYEWCTSGPIAFAHLYVPPIRLESVIAEEFDAEGRGATLAAQVGCRDRFLEPLFLGIIEEIRSAPVPSRLLLDGLLQNFHERLAQRGGPRKARASLQPLALAPYRLQRVLDYMEANLGRDLGLADLVGAAESSQSHFSHAFHKATGASPYSYLIGRRIAYAKVLLLSGSDSLEAISAACGFQRKDQFAFMFKRRVGVGPKRFRMAAGKGRKQERRPPAMPPNAPA